MGASLQRAPSVSNPYQVRPFANDPRRVHRSALGPEDASASSGRRDASHYRSTANLFQQLKVERHPEPDNGAVVDSLDVVPARRSSPARRHSPARSASDLNQAATSSAMPSKFSIRSKTSPKPLQRTSIFKRLPQNVYDCILEQLRDLHSDRLSPSCATCFMRDLVALQLTSRSWDQGVRKTLYSNIHISDNDSHSQLKKYKMKYGSRLRLLRRTLRELRMLGNLVHEITVPDPALPPLLPNGKPNPQFEEYRDLIASVVMVCPNLERLHGFYTTYTHNFDRLSHALSTRKKLKEHVWIVAENQEVTARSHYQTSPGLLDQQQVYQFMHYHHAWSQLETLMFCSPGGAGVLEHELFAAVFPMLPSLKHLCVSCFDQDDFTDETLFALPSLTSLRLEECAGVSDYGLARWSATPAARSLESLTLLHQGVEGLLSISKILSSLPQLLKFTIVQATPMPPPPDDLMIFQPIMASSSLKHLHWDVAPSGHFISTKYYAELPPTSHMTQTANSHLAASVQHAGFPNLLTLRAPQDLDPPGIIQDACRPTTNASILLASDRYALPPTISGGKLLMPDTLSKDNSLHAARVRAQSYINAASASEKDFCKVIVTDHSDYASSRHDSTSTDCTASTNPTNPDDIFSDGDELIMEAKGTRPLSQFIQSSKEVSDAIFSMLGASEMQKRNAERSSSGPVKLREYNFPPFLGRVSVSLSCSSANSTINPPRFHLLPDVAEYDTEGGIIGWGDLLKLKEKDDRAVNGPAWIRDGCTGRWNHGCAGGSTWWKHPERERRGGTVIGTNHFF